MAKLVDCLPQLYHVQALEKYGRGRDKDILTSGDAKRFVSDKANELMRGKERAEKNIIAFARMWEKIQDYERPATRRDVRKYRKESMTIEKGDMIKDPVAGLKALVYNDRYEMFQGANLQNYMDGINSMVHAKLSEMITEFAPTHLGLNQNRKLQADFVRAIFGDPKVSQKYKDFAIKWNQLNDELIMRYNEANASELGQDSFPLPIDHEAQRVKKHFANVKEYTDFMKTLVHPDMINENGGIDGIIGFFNEIITDGASEISMSRASRNPFQSRFDNQRFFKFKDAESWLKYQSMVSRQSPYGSMMGHMTLIAREIGLKEMLGPSADSTFRHLTRSTNIMAADPHASSFAQKAYANLAGKLTPESAKLGSTFQALRNTVTGAKLGGATLSAVPDTVFSALTAQYNGLSMTRNAYRFMKNLAATPSQTKKNQVFAAQLGFVLNHAIDQLHMNARVTEIRGNGVGAKWAEATIRGSGLNRWTIAGKQAFHMEFMQVLATDFSNNTALMNTLGRYGFDDAEIAKIRAGGTKTYGGAEFFDPFSLDTELAQKINGMVTAETRYAVPEPDVAVEAVMNRGTKRGTIGGELLRTGTQFKAFTASIAMSHIARVMRGRGAMSRGSYATQLFTATTLLGAVAIWAKDLAKGNEPRSPDNLKFWADAAAAGGAFSFMSDFFLTDVDKYGQSLADYLAGPLGGELNKILIDGLIGTGQDVVTGEKAWQELLSVATNTAADYTPGNFWYTRLLMERYMTDEIRRLGDPDFDRKLMQREMRRRQEPGANERWFK